MVELILYSRPGCHRCQQMRSVVSSLLKDDVLLREVDVSSDDILNSRYGNDVPVLVCKNQRLAQRRANRQDLEKKITRLRGW
ncbi:glutaredoxin family protein [Bdellovibrionota bacterium]